MFDDIDRIVPLIPMAYIPDIAPSVVAFERLFLL